MLIDRGELTVSEALERNRIDNPSKPFIHYHERVWTYEEADREATGFGDFLLASGARKGDRVCMLLPRVPELIITFLGALKIGAVPVPVNYTLGEEEVGMFVGAASASTVVVHEKYLSALGPDPLRWCGNVVVVGGERKGLIPWEKACAPRATGMAGMSGLDEMAYLNYTTGSSGFPKGAIATHANIYWNTKASIDAFSIGPDDVHLCMFASFAHPHELFARALYTGGTIVLIEEINPKTLARTIRGKGVTCMMGLAPMYDMLISHCSRLDLGGLRIAESGGMFTRPDIISGFRRHFGIPVLSVWGSTETTGIALANTPENFREDGSAGRQCPHYEVKVINEHGREAGDGEIGEMAFFGRGVVPGYYEDVEFSSVDGWYKSGDLAYRDTEGFHYFVERKSGLLKVAGLKVYPLQVEIVIQSHPGVKEAAVIGVEDRLRGVVPKVFIIPENGSAVTAGDVKKFCKDKLADYMIPKEIQIVERLPRIGSGKIDKKALKRIHNESTQGVR